MPKDISVDTRRPFYILLGSISYHSFISAGYVDASGKERVLAEIGKGVGEFRQSSCPTTLLCSALFSQIDSKLRVEERLIRENYGGNHHHFSYVAYNIGYQNYLQLLGLLSFIDPALEAYVPIEASPSRGHNIKLRYQAVGTRYANLQQLHVAREIASHSKHLSINNNCRHSALELLNFTQGRGEPNPNISSFYMNSLHYKNVMYRGGFLLNLYCLPPPPVESQMDAEKFKVLSRLFRRLEKIPKHSPENPLTRNKFNALKTAYLCQIDSINQPMDEFMASLLLWGENNRELIATHRGWHFFSQPSATAELFDSLKHACARNPD